MLPSSDKRRDAEHAAKHLSHALASLSLVQHSCAAGRLPGLMEVLARVRRKSIECFAFLR